MFKFDTIHIPRKSNGGFRRDVGCTKCGAKTTVYLRVIISYEFYDEIRLDLCRKCLEEGTKMICDRMIEEILIKGG